MLRKVKSLLGNNYYPLLLDSAISWSCGIQGISLHLLFKSAHKSFASCLSTSPKFPENRKPDSSRSKQLSEVLQTLQDEFGQMSFDHQQLSKLIQESPTAELKENLECELEVLVGKMEAKASQITKVRKYQAQLEKQKMENQRKELRTKKTLDEEGNSSSHCSGNTGTSSKRNYARLNPEQRNGEQE